MKQTRALGWVTMTVLSCLATVAHSQTEPATYLAGTTISHFSLAQTNELGQPYTTILLKPALGRFVARNVAIGVEIPFYYRHLRAEPEVITSRYVGVSPFVRYYLGPSEWVKPFGGISVGWRSSRYQVVDSTDPYWNLLQRESGLLYGATTGVAFFFNPTVSFEVSATYSYSREVSRDNVDVRLNGLSYGISQLLGINLGFQVYFARDKHKLRCTY